LFKLNKYTPARPSKKSAIRHKINGFILFIFFQYKQSLKFSLYENYNKEVKTKAIILTILTLFLFTTTAEAKVLPQARKAPAVTKTKAAGISVSSRLRADRKSLVINFSGLQNASAVSYMLTYKTNIQDEGAMGALNLNGGNSQTQELLFGTCSKNVCRYHSGVKDAKLDISYTLKSGKKYLRKFKIKV